MNAQPSVLLIYTGGTIGMVQDPVDGSLKPVNFKYITEQVPELKKFEVDLHAESFNPPIDSSDMQPETWQKLASIIEHNYDLYDGFVILHGSDTMAFTASALSFMLENLAKPVILTGSQLPIGIIRTDGKENLISAIEIATARNASGQPLVPEVAVYFEYRLYRGNRTHKYNADHFDAFESPNYPELAEAGVSIKYNHTAIAPIPKGKLSISPGLVNEIAVLKLFPGITENVVESILNIRGLKAVVMETFGSGNGPTKKWFLDCLKRASDKGIIILNITQCNSGSVVQGKYETSRAFEEIGVISGKDMTTEAAITKLMFLLGCELPPQETKRLLGSDLRGELTE